MMILKFGMKDLIISGLCTTLLIILFFFDMIHPPNTMAVQNSVPGRLNCFMGTNGAGPATNHEQDKFMSPVMAANLTGGVNWTAIEEEFPGLNEILEKAALPNKTIILTTLNAAWASKDSMIDLFLGSFYAGEGISHYLNNLIIIALDQVSYDRCREIHRHCLRLETADVDFAGEKFFMSDDYLKMLWRRVELLTAVLELGYDLIFSDADILWFRDPFPHLSPDADFQIACDQFYGDPTDLNNRPNGGFVFVRSSRRTVGFYKYWHESRLDYPTQHDQDVFNSIKRTTQFAEFELKLEFLDTAYFGGFCEVSTNLSRVCTMHANCCTGLERKLFDLKLTILDWAHYRTLTPKEREARRVFWQAPKECLNSFTHSESSPNNDTIDDPMNPPTELERQRVGGGV